MARGREKESVKVFNARSDWSCFGSLRRCHEVLLRRIAPAAAPAAPPAPAAAAASAAAATQFAEHKEAFLKSRLIELISREVEMPTVRSIRIRSRELRERNRTEVRQNRASARQWLLQR